ncbi:MAG: LysR family transcriptional regulator [Oceanobacter sp.]
MNIRTLRNFVMVAETLHFGEAARRLHMTQPPLSRQIAALEKSLGISLFLRHSRSVQLTPAGESFCHNARRLIADYDFAVRTAQATARGERGELRIGFTMCAAWSILPDVLADFSGEYPDVSVKLDETLPRDLQQALLSGEVDLGISFPVPTSSGVCYRALFQEPLCVVLPHSHPLTRQAVVSVAELMHERFITFPPSTAPELHSALMACCRAHHFEPVIQLETHLQQTIVNLVAKGLGVALVPDSMRKMQLEGAVFKSLQQSPTVEQGVFWTDKNENPSLRLLLNGLPKTHVIGQSHSDC